MEHPKCRTCGERHRLGPCAGPRRRKAVADPIPPAPAEEAPPKKRAARGTFDRAAYQRELMRKRRAAAKLSTPKS